MLKNNRKLKLIKENSIVISDIVSSNIIVTTNSSNNDARQLLPKWITTRPVKSTIIIERSFPEITENISKSPVILYGIAGIGKTTIAKEYVLNREDHYNHIAWIVLKEPIKVALLKTFDFWDGINWEQFINRLARVDGNKIIIFDNLSDFNDLDKIIIDLIKTGWNFLVTTKRKPTNSEIFKIVPIHKLDISSSIKLFKSHYKNWESDPDEINLVKILEKIDYHTFTLCLMAKFLNLNNKFKIIDLESELIEEGLHKVNGSLDLGDYEISSSENETTIISTLLYIFNFYELNIKEFTCLRYLVALFGTKGINRAEFLSYIICTTIDKKIYRTYVERFIHFFGNVIHDIDFYSFQNGDDILDTLNSLDEKGLIEVHEDTIKLHPLINQIIFDTFIIIPSNCDEIIINLINKIRGDAENKFKNIDWDTLSLVEYLDHSVFVNKRPTFSLWLLYYYVGLLYFERKQYFLCLEYLNNCTEIVPHQLSIWECLPLSNPYFDYQFHRFEAWTHILLHMEEELWNKSIIIPIPTGEAISGIDLGERILTEAYERMIKDNHGNQELIFHYELELAILHNYREQYPSAIEYIQKCIKRERRKELKIYTIEELEHIIQKIHNKEWKIIFPLQSKNHNNE